MYRVVFEILPSGKMSPYPFSSILYLDRYPLDSFSSWFSLVFDGLVAIWVIWYFIEEVIQIYREGYKNYFSQFWNFIDIINLLLFFAVGYPTVAWARLFRGGIRSRRECAGDRGEL